jgi:hypothetical protein
MQNQLIDVATAIKTGKNEKEIYESHPIIAARFPKFISKTISFTPPAPLEKRLVELHWGAPGTGKTRHCWNLYPDLYPTPIKCSRSGSQWFDGYYGQEVALLDDFNGELQLTQLLRLLDRYPCQVETKGGHVWWNPKVILITTNTDWREWYDYRTRTDSRDALKRRIHLFFMHSKKGSGYFTEEVTSELEPKVLTVNTITPKTNPVNRPIIFDVDGNYECNK